METPIKRIDTKQTTKWFSTGFMSGGVTKVDAEKHTLCGASVIRPGEALGHGVWIDAEMCAQVAKLGNTGKAANGLKARFGHPNMCSDALGTFIGRWKNFSVNANGGVVADLFLSSTAEESPKGNLRKYVEELAAKEPNHFGASIVFTRDMEAEKQFALAHGATDRGEYLSLDAFKSPDPANVNNLPHARCLELHAADLVDDPAATDGMFSGASGLSLAASVTEYLDTHPQIFEALQKDDGILEILASHGDKLEPFLAKYAANKSKKFETSDEVTVENCPACGGEGMVPCPDCNKQSSPEAEPSTPAQPVAAEPAPATPEMSSQDMAELLRLRSELAAISTRADTAEKANEALTKERNELAEKLTLVETAKLAAETQRNEAQKRIEALEYGQPPVSSVPAPEKPVGNFWEEVRASKKAAK